MRMTAFINIAQNDSNPLYVDPASITAIYQDMQYDRLQLFNEDGVFWNGKAGGKLDPDYIVQTMQNHGHALASFPVRWRHDKDSTFYVAPHAVTYATIGKADEEGTLGAIFGVKGVVRKETERVTLVELEPVLDAVRRVKPLLHYAPEKASAYWHTPVALYVDPQAVTRIQEYGTELKVNFNKSADLRIETPREMSFKVIDRLSFEARATMQALEKQVMQTFARELATANGKLLSVEFAESAFHTRYEDIEYMEFVDHKDDDAFKLWLQMKKATGAQNTEDVVLRYKTREDRLKSFEALNSTKPGVMTQPAPAP